MSNKVYADVLQSNTRWPKRRQRWFVRITAANHKALSTSEMYTNRDDAIRTAKLVLVVWTTASLYVGGEFVETLRVATPKPEAS